METREKVYMSTFNQHGILELAESFHDNGWNIVAEGNTFEQINASSIPVMNLADLGGGHSAIAAGVSLPLQGQKPIKRGRTSQVMNFSAVCIDMMPPKLISNSGYTDEEKVEKFDFIRPELLSLAASCGRIAVSQDSQRPIVAEWLSSGRPHEASVVATLAAVAVKEAAAYISSRNALLTRVVEKRESVSGLEEDLRQGLKHTHY